MEYIIEKPSKEGIMYIPGLKVSLTDDKSLVELFHYYDSEVTQIVGIRTKDLPKLIEALQDINSFLHADEDFQNVYEKIKDEGL